jgi:hypothetical protein
MEKARVLECYKIDDQAYQGTCTAIGLKNPDILTGGQLDHFDRVRGWLDKKEVKNFKEATERFKAEAGARAKAESKANLSAALNNSSLESSLHEPAVLKAESTLQNGLDRLNEVDQHIQRSLITPYVREIYQQVQSPEFQEKYRKACEGETVVDADFFTEIMMEIEGESAAAFPALLPSPPSSSTSSS